MQLDKQQRSLITAPEQKSGAKHLPCKLPTSLCDITSNNTASAVVRKKDIICFRFRPEGVDLTVNGVCVWRGGGEVPDGWVLREIYGILTNRVASSEIAFISGESELLVRSCGLLAWASCQLFDKDG